MGKRLVVVCDTYVRVSTVGITGRTGCRTSTMRVATDVGITTTGSLVVAVADPYVVVISHARIIPYGVSN